MSLQQKLIISGANTGLVKIAFAIAIAIIGFCLSINIDASFATSSNLFWFILLSQLVYVAIFLFSVTKLLKIFLKQQGNNQKFLQAKLAIDKLSEESNIPIHVKDALSNSAIKSSIAGYDNLSAIIEKEVEEEFVEEINKKQPIYLDDEFYETIPLPLIITNKEGIINNYNKQAQSFFNTNLHGKNISEFIDIISTQVLQEVSVVTVKLQTFNKENFISSLFQTTVYDNNEIVSVILFFLPFSIESNNKTEDNNSLLSHQAFEKEEATIITDDFNKKIDENYEPFSLDAFSNTLDVGVIVLKNKQNIINFNSKALELLETDLNKTDSNPFNFNLNNGSEQQNSNIKQNFIGSDFKTVFNEILTIDQITRILNTINGKEQINLKEHKTIELYFCNKEDLTTITLLDISERKKLELQNTFSQRLQTVGQIASAVAHDFNNLLTAIMSFTYFLKERYVVEDPSSLELEQIEQNANRAKVMIRQLLTFSRGKELNPIAFSVNSEISNLMSTILRLMGERIKTEFVRGKNIGKITMDQVQFQQVVINLVVNARDAMKNGGNLTISTEHTSLKQPKEGAITTIPAGEYITIKIQDQGEGIKRENFKKIFQTHFSTKGDKGNGLGLATVSKIIQENSGFVALESEVNVGTTFYLYFPVEESIIKEEGLTKNSYSLTINNISNQNITLDLTGSGTILLVEDEVSVRTVCKRALVNKGYQVIEAEDAETALTLLQNSTNKVDLVISDVMMPGISGLEFISEAKKIIPELKVILMSGYAEDTLEDSHYTLDSIEFLAKPFNPDVLATKVKKVFSN